MDERPGPRERENVPLEPALVPQVSDFRFQTSWSGIHSDVLEGWIHKSTADC